MRKITLILAISAVGLIAIRVECGCTGLNMESALCWTDSYGSWAVGAAPVGTLPIRGVFREGLKQGAKKLPVSGVIRFKGFKVMGTRPFLDAVKRHPVDYLHDMVNKGAAGRLKGDVLHLHHMGRDPAGPITLIPARLHLWKNKKQHPVDGIGLTKKQRNRFKTWKVNFWKAMGCQELKRRGLKVPRKCRRYL